MYAYERRLVETTTAESRGTCVHASLRPLARHPSAHIFQYAVSTGQSTLCVANIPRGKQVRHILPMCFAISPRPTRRRGSSLPKILLQSKTCWTKNAIGGVRRPLCERKCPNNASRTDSPSWRQNCRSA
ncbi:unnamed protein product [Ectocarpus sp. 13 AM-2016]